MKNLLLFPIKLIILSTLFILNRVESQSCVSRYKPFYKGQCTLPTKCKGAILNNLCSGSLKCCINETSLVYSSFITENELVQIAGNNERVRFLSKYITSPTTSMSTSCFQKAEYISQLAHESANFMYSEELGSESYFSKYDYNTKLGRQLGNTLPGDGAKYKGRGFIQLTGKSNYQRAGAYLNLPLVDNPEMVALPSISAKTAVWFWLKGSSIDLNKLADGTFYNFSIMTSKINGGLNHLDSRTLILEKALSVLKCNKLTKGSGEKCLIDRKQAKCIPLCVTGLEGKDYCGCKGTSKSGLCTGPSNIKCCLEN